MNLLAAALTVLLASSAPGVPVVAAPAPAPAATETLTIWQWNVAGWILNAGSTTNGMVDAAVSSILYRDADMVAFNEICWDQYVEIRARLAEAGWPQTNNYYRFAPALRYRCAGESFGNALFSRRPLGATNWITLPREPADVGETRNLLCAPVLRKKLRFCVTHLTPHGMVTTQAEQVRTSVEAWENAGETVIVAGDFNSEPDTDRLNAWYASAADTPRNPANQGRHRELDDTSPACPGYGEATTYRTTEGACGAGPRIDLIFIAADKLTGPYFADSPGVVTTCGGPCSDHRIVYGRATVRVG